MTSEVEQQQFTLPNAGSIRNLWKGPNFNPSHNDQSGFSETRRSQFPQQLQLSPAAAQVAKEIPISPSHLQIEQGQRLPSKVIKGQDSAQDIEAGLRVLRGNNSSSLLFTASDSAPASPCPTTIGGKAPAMFIGGYDTGSGLHSASALAAIRKLAMIAQRAFGNRLGSTLLTADPVPTSNRIPSHISYLGEQPAFSICGSNNGCDYGRDGLNLLRANDTKFKSSSNDSVHFPARPPQTSSLAETFAFPANGYRGFSDCSLGSTSASSERSDVTSQGSSHYDAVLARLTAECKWRRKCPQLQKALIYWNSLALPSHSLQGDLANCSLATKVFLGGLPYDTTQMILMNLFSKWGVVTVQIPPVRQNSCRRLSHAYLVFEEETHVRRLLSNCVKREPGSYFFWVPSTKSRGGRFAQVIPWATQDNDWISPDMTTHVGANAVASSSCSGPKQRNTCVFIGGVHGEVSAKGLQLIMAQLFGPVLHAGIDTDCHGYPSGSARVTFASQESFYRALRAGFVQLETARFSKLMQLDPFVDEVGRCATCEMATVLFCRHIACLKYFCAICFEDHRRQNPGNDHPPLTRPRTNYSISSPYNHCGF
ncbi:uncharacterized protein LOC111244911 isoform X2 [Varroa destructor]|uniref:RRM domain-containing protein n=1 Tax=Varroa destructor TaxID=109461 RepID=A0A7M7J857_VARDE|nr:uncharacterized protein LOC111244911 isoform X2 [Varroa destructor]